MALKEAAQLQLDYMAWASERLLAAAAQLTEDELTRDFGTADKNVLGTLLHVFGADRVWWRRLNGIEQRPFINEHERSLGGLQSAWTTVLGDWRRWAATVSEEALAADVTYTDSAGNVWTTPLWQIVSHVVNHGTHHRGQVSGFLRSMGRTPPPLDLMAYCREMQKAAGQKAPPRG